MEVSEQRKHDESDVQTSGHRKEEQGVLEIERLAKATTVKQWELGGREELFQKQNQDLVRGGFKGCRAEKSLGAERTSGAGEKPQDSAVAPN